MVREIDPPAGWAGLRISRSPEIVGNVVGESFVAVNPRDGGIYDMQGTARHIWELLSSEKEAVQIVMELAAEYDADPELIRDDVGAFLADLSAAGLLLVSPR